MPQEVELPGVPRDEATFVGFRRKDMSEQSLMYRDQDGVFGPVVCVSWEEARYYLLIELDHGHEPFELSRVLLAALTVEKGFTGVHVYRVHEGKTYRKPEPFS